MRPNPQKTANLVTFTEEVFNGKLYFLCSVCRALSNFDFDLTITKKMHWVFQLFGNKVMERISLTNRTEHPN